MYIIIEVVSGVLATVRLTDDGQTAINTGSTLFKAATGKASMHEHLGLTEREMSIEEPDYDPNAGGVAYNYIMHWWTGNIDIWIVEEEAIT